jgi:hypothetical protein
MKVVAVLETMWDWRQRTSRAGYTQAPRQYRINPANFTGKRLYRIVGHDHELVVTNACPQLVTGPNQHGTPDPAWLLENLELIAPFDLLLVCGKVAEKTYGLSGHEFEHTIFMPHPAARMWTHAMLDEMTEKVRAHAARVDQ